MEQLVESILFGSCLQNCGSEIFIWSHMRLKAYFLGAAYKIAEVRFSLDYGTVIWKYTFWELPTKLRKWDFRLTMVELVVSILFGSCLQNCGSKIFIKLWYSWVKAYFFGVAYKIAQVRFNRYGWYLQTIFAAAYKFAEVRFNR